uniref:Uncharacterized protein n=1 Tax=Ceratitis capitata TaxID=7213 RepID=W8B1S6_CERCA
MRFVAFNTAVATINAIIYQEISKKKRKNGLNNTNNIYLDAAAACLPLSMPMIVICNKAATVSPQALRGPHYCECCNMAQYIYVCMYVGVYARLCCQLIMM